MMRSLCSCSLEIQRGAQQVAFPLRRKITWLRKLLAGKMILRFWRSGWLNYVAVFDDRVYVFTPKGEVVDLPAGSTPLDFALCDPQ